MSKVDKFVDRQKFISHITKNEFVDESQLRSFLEIYLPQFEDEDQHILGFLLLGILNTPYLDWQLDEDAWVVAETLLPKDRQEHKQLDALKMWSRKLTSTNHWQPIARLEEFWGLNGYPLLSLQKFEDASRESSDQAIEELIKTCLDFFNANEDSPKDPRRWHQQIWEARSNYSDRKILKRHEFVVRALIEQSPKQTELLILYLVKGQSKKEICTKFNISEVELRAFKSALDRTIWHLADQEKEYLNSLPKPKIPSNRDVITETQYDPFQRS